MAAAIKSEQVAVGDVVREEVRVKTVTGVRPGLLAIRDTDGDHFKLGGDEDAEVYGIIERNLSNPDWDQVSDPVAEERFTLIVAGKARASLATGNNGARGALVVSAASGEVKLEAHDVTATVNQTTVNAAIEEAIAVLGKLTEDKDASAGALAATIRLRGGA